MLPGTTLTDIPCHYAHYQVVKMYTESHIIKNESAPPIEVFDVGEEVCINRIEGEWGRDLRGCWVMMKYLRLA